MGASNNNPGTLNGAANEAITEFTFVDTAGTTAKEALKFSVADTGDTPIGIAQSTVTSGETVGVVTAGETFLTVDGSGTAIVAGDYLKPSGDSDGLGIKAAADGDAYGAKALEPSTADGDRIRVLVVSGTLSVPA